MIAEKGEVAFSGDVLASVDVAPYLSSLILNGERRLLQLCLYVSPKPRKFIPMRICCSSLSLTSGVPFLLDTSLLLAPNPAASHCIPGLCAQWQSGIYY